MKIQCSLFLGWFGCFFVVLSLESSALADQSRSRGVKNSVSSGKNNIIINKGAFRNVDLLP